MNSSICGEVGKCVDEENGTYTCLCSDEFEFINGTCLSKYLQYSEARISLMTGKRNSECLEQLQMVVKFSFLLYTSLQTHK